MAGRTPQTRSNHVRYDPMFHFFLVPALLALIVWSGVHLVRHPSGTAGMLFCLAVLMVFVVLKARLYALRVQDRLIRLEERVRLAMLDPDASVRLIPQLTEAQLIALRFASDAELPGLAERAAVEKLAGKEIKDAIREWRPDYWRV